MTYLEIRKAVKTGAIVVIGTTQYQLCDVCQKSPVVIYGESLEGSCVDSQCHSSPDGGVQKRKG